MRKRLAAEFRRIEREHRKRSAHTLPPLVRTLQGRPLITMYAFLRTVPACWGCTREKEGAGRRAGKVSSQL